MSRFTTVFKKLNGKASEAAVAAVVGKKIVWSPEELRMKRLVTFIKGIRVTGAGVSAGIVGVNEFEINVDTFDYDNLTFDFHRVSNTGNSIAIGMKHKMVEMEDHVKIAYEIDKYGQYTLDVKYLGLPVPSSPFTIDVRDMSNTQAKPNAKNVIAYGKGLKKCVTGEVTTLHLETRKAGLGQLSVATDGIKDIPTCITESKLGYTIQYVATSVGEFFLRVKMDGKHIAGSPFLIKAEKKRVAPESAKNLFKRGVLVGSKEKKNDLQP